MPKPSQYVSQIWALHNLPSAEGSDLPQWLELEVGNPVSCVI